MMTTLTILLLVPCIAVGQTAVSGHQDPGLPGDGPSFRDILSLQSVGSPAISPDGRRVAFRRSIPDWEKNRSVQELWLAGESDDPVRLATESDGFRGAFQWTPDGEWLTFRGDGASLIFFSPDRGDSKSVDVGVEGAYTIRFSPDGQWIALLAAEAVSERERREQELYGPFSFRDEGARNSHLWIVSSDGEGKPRKLSDGEFTVTDYAWSPDGREIAFVHQDRSGRNTWWKADLSVVTVQSSQIRPLAKEPGADVSPMWSPDGERIAFMSTLADSITNLPAQLVVVSSRGGAVRPLTDELPTEANPLLWTTEGLYLTALEGVEPHLFRLHPEDGSLVRVSEDPYLIVDASVTPDGSALAIAAATSDSWTEIYRTGSDAFEPHALTNTTRQLDGWELGSREVIRWAGPGGVAIEGILHKPSDYDPSRRYPLLVIVHGGPRSVSIPWLTLTSGAYPVTHFLSKGALVLEPNYRGSVGYGGEFRQRHHRALGWGDAGDVEAGVQHLVGEGLVDSERVGVMGWSYGGFISAYLTATSQSFAAVSVGAGISDWRTHYAWEPMNFTTRYYSFGATPWEDPYAYEVASPITYINNASTPTLIQHVDGDPIVTVLNAYELQSALQDRGVENRFAIYRGSGHGIGTLKQRLGALWHNWQWFLKHIWNEHVELPMD